MNRPPHHGFALVEMVIVILTLGIIAVIAAPRFYDTESRAQQETTRRHLNVLRDAIELYHSQSGTYPPTDQLPAVMANMLNGPFPSPTIGTVRGDSAVYYDLSLDTGAPVIPDPGRLGGWAYKPANGSLKLNVDASEVGADW